MQKDGEVDRACAKEGRADPAGEERQARDRGGLQGRKAEVDRAARREARLKSTVKRQKEENVELKKGITRLRRVLCALDNLFTPPSKTRQRRAADKKGEREAQKGGKARRRPDGQPGRKATKRESMPNRCVVIKKPDGCGAPWLQGPCVGQGIHQAHDVRATAAAAGGLQRRRTHRGGATSAGPVEPRPRGRPSAACDQPEEAGKRREATAEKHSALLVDCIQPGDMLEQHGAVDFGYDCGRFADTLIFTWALCRA